MFFLNSIRKNIYEGINYRLRTFAGGRFASVCRPTSIALLMSERCNARCLHCDIWKNRGKEDSPSEAQWRSVLWDLRKWLGPVQVVFTGGEALLQGFTINLVKYSSSIGLFTELLTHGYWEDQNRIETVALAKPARVTVSFDGLGATHSLIRGKDNFFEKTERTIRTLSRMRRERNLKMAIRLKTVIMRQNVGEVSAIANFAEKEGLEVFYQPIEQNYNTPDDPHWFEHSPNWPTDIEMVAAVINTLQELKTQGLPIANSSAQLAAMVPYFKDPGSLRVATQSHAAHEKKLSCSALTTLQIQANGDVTVCPAMEPVGNIKVKPVREIWEERPHWWKAGCCLEHRLTTIE